MAKEIRVHLREGIWGDGYACDHAAVDPKKAGDVVLCQKCSDAVARGANIAKMEESGARR